MADKGVEHEDESVHDLMTKVVTSVELSVRNSCTVGSVVRSSNSAPYVILGDLVIFVGQ